MQDYLLLNTLTGSKINLLLPAVFLLILLSMPPWALLFRAAVTGARSLAKSLTKKE